MHAVYDRLSRSWKPDHGKSKRDQAHRGAKLLATLGQAKFQNRSVANADPILAFLATARNDLVAAAPASPLKHADIDIIGEKFALGLLFAESGTTPSPSQFTARVVNDDLFVVGGAPTRPLVDALRSLPASARLAPGLRYRAKTSSTGDQVWLFLLWGQLELLTIVVPKQG